MNSPAPDRPQKPESRSWALLSLLLAAAATAVWLVGAGSRLAWHAGDWTRRPWELWSASLAHLSGAHLLANLGALAVLAVLGACLHAGRAATLALLAAWPVGTLALAWWPQVTAYSGMSGLLNAMAAVLWAHCTLRGSAKPVSFVIFTVLALKLLSEHAWVQPIAFDPNWGFNVVYAAHFAGALAGAACGLVFESAALLRGKPQA